ncbi:solute carrier family 35 member G1-like [Dermacentor variabilis]|uniref:solute carrier family 35 member G1-like n=1 Tax=Dermacentor variabilis TaxID=34621 RepID=UPI003F5BD7C5
MTAGDSKAGDDVSVEVAAAKLAAEGTNGEPIKDPNGGPGKGSDGLPYLRRHSSVHMLAQAAWREAAGITAALGTGLAISVGGLLIGLVEVIPPLAVSGLRCVCSVLYLLPVIALFRPQLLADKGNRIGLAAVSVVLALRALTFTLGSSTLPLAEFSLLINTMPVFAAIFGCAILEERCGPREMTAGLLVLGGILVAFLPTLLLTPDVGTSISGIVITLACAIFQAMAFVILRRLSCQVSPITVSLWTSVATVVLCVPPAGALGQLRHLDTEPLDVAYTAGAGLTALLTALLPTIACTLAEAGRVAIATTSSVVFSFALQAAVQLKAPTPWALVGAGFIVAAVVCSNLKWEPSVDILEKLKLKGSGEKDKEPFFAVKDYGTVPVPPSTKSP